MFLYEPEPCLVCGAAHSACKGEKDDSAGVGVTRGVIVHQLPSRAPAAPAAVVQTSARPAGAVTSNQ